MKKFSKIALCFLLVVAFAFSATACNKDSGIEGIDMISSVSIDVNDEYTLQATLLPFGAEGTISWKSSDTSVATVSDSGVVKGIAAGTASIKASAGGVSATCSVTVIDPSQATINVSSITLSPGVLTFEEGDTQPKTISATIRPANATYQTLTWKSGDPTIATVNNGVVTPVAPGQTLITATAHNNISKACLVTVKGDGSEQAKKELYVRKVDSLENRTNFIMGMDASAVPSLEDAGVVYKNFDGQVEDVYQILKDNGITDIRIRIWNYPYQDGHYGDVEYSYGGGNCDVENAIAIAKRCKAAGLGVIIDFHYSDFWADPGKQYVPKAWKNLSVADRKTAIHDFTSECLTKIKQESDVKITMVQIGNETTRSICGASWDSAPTTYCEFINAGAQAVREVTGTVANGGAKVAIHLTNPESRDYPGYATTFKNNNVDYDVFGSSYYPFWHGTLDNLSKKLAQVHTISGKEVMVLETSYAFTEEDFDGNGNTRLNTQTYPFTVQGQANQILDVIETIADLGDYGLGVCYWEGTWVAPANNSTESLDLCNRFGCGWASAKAGPSTIGGDGYQSNDVTAAGGVVIDNQAFFMTDGTPLESLKLFGLAKVGQIVAPAADYLYLAEQYYTVDEGEIVLPELVKIVLNDGSEMEIDAMWEKENSEIQAWIHTVDTYVVKGTTMYGGEAMCIVYVQNKNLLVDGGFENSAAQSGDNKIIVPAPWKQRHEGGNVLQLYVSNENKEMGEKSFHFWDDAELNFDLYQEIDSAAIAAAVAEYSYGTFSFSIDFMGDKCGDTQDIYAYAKVTYKDGTTKTIKGSDVKAVGWKIWNRTSVDFVIDETVAKIEVGIHVSAEANGWGNMDNAQFFYKSSSTTTEE